MTVENETAEVASPEAPPPDVAEVPAEPAYVPDYKYKVREEEKEFDEDLRPLITNKKLEDRVRKLFAAEGGLPLVQKERDEFKGNYSKLENELREVANHVSKKDLDAAFKGLGIPENAVFEWLKEKIRIEQLSPEQKDLYNQNRQAQSAQTNLERHNTELQERLNQNAYQMRQFELNTVLNRSDIGEFVKKFDATHGNGAFKYRVETLGQNVARNLGKDISAQEAVNAVMAEYSPFLAQATTTLAQPANPQNTVVMQAKAPSIPQVGKSGSPGPSSPRSIKDLKAMAAEKMSQGGE